MRATAGILSLATADSLVIIDELGRGTSPLEGTAIAHAIAEELIRSKAACFFATHFGELATTLSGYESVVNLHLKVDATRKGAVRYSYHIADGVPEEFHYGLQLAEVAGLPADVLAVAHGAPLLNALTRARLPLTGPTFPLR
jgi:DNA mismatch repair protein MSH4